MPDSPDPTARVAALFDALSATYDAVGVDFFGPIAAGLLSAMSPAAGERWLDVGCGRGAVLIPAAEAVGPEGQAVGIDISAGMVDEARRLADALGLANVEVKVGDAGDPHVGGGFDAVSSSLVLFFLTDPAAALQSWRSLLVPGGRLGVATFGPTDPRWEHVDEVFVPHLPPHLRDARTTGKDGPFGSDEGMAALVDAAGFDGVRTVVLDLPVRFADAEQWHTFTWSIGQRAMWLAVPPDQRAEVRAEAERRLASHSAADGSIMFVQTVRYTLATVPS
jgi:ubiquinone/menaquinone biosynthesis C-methylase UbiE